MKVACPRCGAEIELAAGNPNRPFCSDRCRNVDLHAWTSDQYRIDADAPAVDEQGPPDQAGTSSTHSHN